MREKLLSVSMDMRSRYPQQRFTLRLKTDTLQLTPFHGEEFVAGPIVIVFNSFTFSYSMVSLVNIFFSPVNLYIFLGQTCTVNMAARDGRYHPVNKIHIGLQTVFVSPPRPALQSR